MVREAARRPSSWRGRSTLEGYLSEHGVVGIRDVDTRALTRHIRSKGAMRGGIADADMPVAELLRRILAHPRMEGLELACGVSTRASYVVTAAEDHEAYHVAAFDFGVKSSSPRLLSERGCRVTVLPAQAGTADVLALEPDGLFISNGPGDPAAVEQAVETILEVVRRDVPVFGICLGHQPDRARLRRRDLQAPLRAPRGQPSGDEP